MTTSERVLQVRKAVIIVGQADQCFNRINVQVPYLILAIFATGLFTELDFLGLPVTLALAACLLFLGSQSYSLKFPSKPTLKQIGWGLLFSLPVVLYFTGTWNQEFPDSGDHTHQLWAQESAWRFWHTRITLVFVFVGVFFGILPALLKRKVDFSKYSKYWTAFVLMLLYWWSFRAHVEPYFARYPGTQYTIAYFVDEVLRFFHFGKPLLAGRLTNVFSVPVWLFLLRPLFLKRWPGPELGFFVLFYFLQEQVLYYFTSVMLEPWACIFVALATEALILTTEGAKLMQVSLMSLGFAAIIKEHSVLLFPGFALAFFPFESVLGKTKSRAEIKLYFKVLLTSMMPFLLYYYFRKKSGVSREASLILNDLSFFTSRWSEWIFRFRESQTVGALIAIVLSIAGVFYYIIRAKTLLLGIGLLFSILIPFAFVYLDKNSEHWTGYPRFQLLFLVVLGAPAFHLGHSFFLREYKASLKNSRVEIALKIVSVLFAVILITASIPVFKKAFAPAYARNFIEHYDSPYFFPVRELLAQAPSANTKLKVIWPLGSDVVFDLRIAYQAELHEVTPVNSWRLQDCICNDTSETVLVLELPLVELGLRSPLKLSRILYNSELQTQCLTLISKTCSSVRQATDPIHHTRNGVIAWGIR